MKSFRITTPLTTRLIGPAEPVFIVAEISANHHQRFKEAEELIRQAAAAGADAVKFQTYTPDTMTIDSNQKYFVVGGKKNPASWQKKTLYQIYKKAYTPWEWQRKLKKLADQLGIIFFSTAFDTSSVDFLESINVPCYKIGSYEVTDIPLLKKIAQTKKPVILSIGYASIREVTQAVKTLRQNGCRELAILHCVTSYAARANWNALNLSTIKDIARRYDVVPGYSENSGGIKSTLHAVSAGACIIEKHFILDRRLGGADADFSLEPSELAELVSDIRKLECAPGKPHYGPADETEAYNKRWRRSLFVVKDIKKNEVFTPENIRIIRPEFGLAPKYYDQIVGKTSAQNIRRGTPLSWKMVNKSKLTRRRSPR